MAFEFHELVVLAFAVSVVVSCGPSKEELAQQEKQADGFCASPGPLAFAPEPSAKTVTVFAKSNNPNGLPSHHKWGGPYDWEGDLPTGYTFAGYKSPSSYIVCAEGNHEVLEERKYYYKGTSQGKMYYRTLLHQKLSIYEAKSGKLLHKAQFTGKEPRSFTTEFSSKLAPMFTGKTEPKARKKALKTALP